VLTAEFPSPVKRSPFGQTNEYDCAPLELRALEKLREEELEEARAIQSVMLPAESRAPAR